MGRFALIRLFRHRVILMLEPQLLPTGIHNATVVSTHVLRLIEVIGKLKGMLVVNKIFVRHLLLDCLFRLVTLGLILFELRE